LRYLKLLEIDIDDDVINRAIDEYDQFDTLNMPVDIKRVDDNLFISELYHGPQELLRILLFPPFGVIFSSLAKSKR